MGKKKAVKKKAVKRDGKTLKMESVTVVVRRGGAESMRKEVRQVAIFPEGVPVAQVAVEVNRSKEVHPNDWFSCRVMTLRHCVDHDAEVKNLREKIYMDSCEFVDNAIAEEAGEV